MRRLFLYSLMIFSLTLVSCQKRNVYCEFHKFNNYTWGRFDKVTFTIPIDQADFNADIILSVRHLGEYPYKELPVNIVMTTPSGEERIMEKTIKIRDENNEFIGSVAGNLYDIDEILWNDFNFNRQGTYTIEFENLIPKIGIPAIDDIGLTVRKSKR